MSKTFVALSLGDIFEDIHTKQESILNEVQNASEIYKYEIKLQR